MENFKARDIDVAILDNPGLDEFTKETTKGSLDMIKEVSSTFIIITTLEDYTKKPLGDFLKNMYNHDEGNLNFYISIHMDF